MVPGIVDMNDIDITSDDIIRAGRAVLPKLGTLAGVAAPSLRVQLVELLEKVHNLNRTFYNLYPQPGQRQSKEILLEKKIRKGIGLTGLEKKYTQMLNKHKVLLVQLNVLLRSHIKIWKWVVHHINAQKLPRVS